jgi:hypothetical protein
VKRLTVLLKHTKTAKPSPASVNTAKVAILAKAIELNARIISIKLTSDFDLVRARFRHRVDAELAQ